jgi:sugar O-acyltransferase (sialic acid O-acetyltransferase NeuD family)
MVRVVLVGNGGHARACLDAWPADGRSEVVGYVGPAAGDVLGLPYLGTDDELPGLASRGIERAFVALGSNRVRRAVVDQCTAAGLDLFTAVAPSAQVGASARIGAGSIVMHRAVLGANAVVGRGSIINNGATVDHDCVVGDFVHIAPGVNLAGTLTVGDGAMIGIGASVVPGIRIGAGATVGAGAAVIRDVPDGHTVVGVPAQELKR